MYVIIYITFITLTTTYCFTFKKGNCQHPLPFLLPGSHPRNLLPVHPDLHLLRVGSLHSGWRRADCRGRLRRCHPLQFCPPDPVALSTPGPAVPVWNAHFRQAGRGICSNYHIAHDTKGNQFCYLVRCSTIRNRSLCYTLETPIYFLK